MTGWLKDPDMIRQWWADIRDSEVRWWHYLIAFLAYAAGYWTAWWFGV